MILKFFLSNAAQGRRDKVISATIYDRGVHVINRNKYSATMGTTKLAAVRATTRTAKEDARPPPLVNRRAAKKNDETTT